jgi:DNA-binding SARP family transcriptional activator/DNA-binding GntR family transcriptional regulator
MTEYRILGPLEVADGGTQLPLAGGKARALLARLLIDVNRTVSVDALVDSLWGEEVPASAVKMVHVYVSQLRKVLPAGVLRTRAPGYALEVAPEAVDLVQFTRLRAEGRAALADNDTVTAAARLRAGLALWRGAALAEFSEPFAAAHAAHLDELRVACVEDRIEADLALGHHADLVGELRALVAGHPLRERPRCQLMLALYRAGRQAEALAVYHEFRATLLEELGMEPSAALNELQHRVLNQDPTLDLEAPATRAAASPLRLAVADEPDHDPDVLVGRAGELQELEMAFEAAAAASGTTALVAGPAGIGKTVLASELARRARNSGATVLSGRCIDLVGAGLPYLPLVEAFRPLCSSAMLGEIRDELHELPRLHPDLADGTPLAPHGDGANARLRLFAEVLAVLEHISRRAPVVLIFEDLHWADGSTLDLVTYLAHAVQGRRVLIVATYRSDALAPDHELHRLAAGLRRAGTTVTVELGPLHDADIEALVAASVDELPAELTAAVCARSEGNPFFATELAAAAARGEHDLPPALHDLLLAGIGRLDADTRPLLRVVAAAGRDVPYRLLTAVTELPERTIVEGLRQAVEHHVLVADQGNGSFRFRHALFAEAVYATLLPGEREELHARLASALTQNPNLAASRAIAGELAQHWVAARKPMQALGASLHAARDAQALSGLAEALRHLEQVLELWEDVPTPENLAGLALPAVLAWAAELATMTARQWDDAIDSRALARILGVGECADPATLAAHLDVSTEEAATTLAMLEREGICEKDGDGVFRPARLAVTEARELYPLAIVLESIAVRQSPPFDERTLDAMRSANARLRAALHDPSGAILADDDFHAQLTGACENARLLDALRPVKRALLRYEQIYMRDPACVERSVAQHDAIIAALERGDRAQAAQRVRENLSGGLPDLAAAIER